MTSEEVKGIISRNGNNGDNLISILEGVQSKYSYLPREALETIALETGRSLTDIYGVATFYRAFSLTPRGKHLVSVCLGTACHVRSGPLIAAELKKQLRVRPGETTPDRQFTLETVNCLGACALGPIVVVDGHYFSNVKTTQVSEILEKSRLGLEEYQVTADQRIFPLEVACSRCNHSLMDPAHPIDVQPSIRVTIYFGRKHGWLRLSSLYGSYNSESEYEVPDETLVQIFCPHCHSELIGGSDCVTCGVKMVPMIVRGGGVVQICPTKGCRGHLLDVA